MHVGMHVVTPIPVSAYEDHSSGIQRERSCRGATETAYQEMPRDHSGTCKLSSGRGKNEVRTKAL